MIDVLRRIPLVVVVTASLLLAGCFSAQSGGYVAPGSRLDPAARYFIVFTGSDEQALHEVIARELQARGVAATTGFEDKVPPGTDILVRYAGQWQWDITWYLLDVQLQFYRAGTDELVASGQAFRTSLARKAPDAMVKVALDGAFGASKN
jgi:hypothetical protein